MQDLEIASLNDKNIGFNSLMQSDALVMRAGNEKNLIWSKACLCMTVARRSRQGKDKISTWLGRGAPICQSGNMGHERTMFGPPF